LRKNYVCGITLFYGEVLGVVGKEGIGVVAGGVEGGDRNGKEGGKELKG
jgi:hypothetical protein